MHFCGRETRRLRGDNWGLGKRVNYGSMQRSEDSHSVYWMVHSSGALLAIGSAGPRFISVTLGNFSPAAAGGDDF